MVASLPKWYLWIFIQVDQQQISFISVVYIVFACNNHYEPMPLMIIMLLAPLKGKAAFEHHKTAIYSVQS